MSPKLRRWTGRLGLIIGFLVALSGLIMLRVADPLPVQIARQTAFDVLQRLIPREDLPAPVRVVTVDEVSLAEYGQWPWPRDRLAELVDRLHSAGAAVVAFDFIFAEPDRLSPSRLIDNPILQLQLTDLTTVLPDNDLIFAKTMSEGYVVLGFSGSQQGIGAPQTKAGFAQTGGDAMSSVPQFWASTNPLPVLSEAAEGIGSVSLSNDDSFGVIRRIPLLWSDGQKLYPSLSVEALRVALGASTFIVHVAPDSGHVAALRVGDFEIPTNANGELVMHYSYSRASRSISIRDIFDDERLASEQAQIEGHIVLVGASAAGLHDIRKTTLGETVPGVEIHAQALEQILNKQHLLRHDWVQGTELMLLSFASFVICLGMAVSGARAAFLQGGIVALATAMGTWVAYRYSGIMIDPSYPLIGGGMMWFLATAVRFLVADRDRLAIRGAFRHYVDGSVLEQIEQDFNNLSLGGEDRELTILFTDVRDFTTLSEDLPPTMLVEFLNLLLGKFSSEIQAQGGTIDKFIGDSVMAFWNAPVLQEDHAARACRASLALRSALEELNREFGDTFVTHDRPIEVGVGLNTGTACVGNMGSTSRFDYSAVGDAVNQAARTESTSKEVGFDLVVTRATADQAPDFAFLPAGHRALKGKTASVEMFILVGDPELRKSAAFQELAARYARVIDALRQGHDIGALQDMADCRSIAATLNPRLLTYLDRLPDRGGDFALQERIQLVADSGAGG